MAVFLILASALLTVLTATALGSFFVKRLPLKLEERPVIAFILGSAALSLIVFALCATHLYYRGFVLALCLAAILIAWRFKPAKAEAFEQFDKFERFLLLSFLPFVTIYLINAMAPEASPDGSTYHLGVIAHYARAHGFLPLHTTIYASLSQGIELLYLIAFTFGRHSAAAVVHLVFFSAAAWLMICYGRRTAQTKPAIAAAFLFYASPVAGLDGSSAYIDCATAAILFTIFYLLHLWRHAERTNQLLVAAGLLCGYAYSAKYTAGIIVVYALLVVLATERKLRPALIVAACAVVLTIPWLAKNAYYDQNPLAPFFNRFFPNPYVHVQWEIEYKQYFRDYDMKDLRMIPWAATVTGDPLGGILGPIFLLIPLGLLGLRSPHIRQLWLAGLVCMIPYPLNIGSRFVILALPFLALALTETLALANVRILLPTLMLAHGLLSWPRTPPGLLSRYAGVTWRMIHIPWKQALRIEPEEQYLSRTQPGYVKARLIDRLVPAGEIVFAHNPVLDAYTSHEVVVYFQSALGETIGDLLFTGFKPERQGVRLLRFRIPSTKLDRIRVEQTVLTPPAEQWSISELRFFNAGRELPRESKWRLTANVNWWDIQYAFDNSSVTRWRTQQQSKPGDFVEVDFGSAQTVDQVDVETSADHWKTQIRLRGGGSAWPVLSDKIEELSLQPQPYARRMASLEVAALGVHYLLIEDSDYGGRDIFDSPEAWGLKQIGEAVGARLYYILPAKSK